MDKPQIPTYVDRDHVLVENLQPDIDHADRGENWAVIRKGLTRRVATTEREFLRDGGVFTETTPDGRSVWGMHTAEQWRTWEEYQSRRVALFVKEWSFQDDDGRLLPVSRDSVGELPDRAFVALCDAIVEAERPPSPEDAKSNGAAAGGLGAGPANASAELAADREQDHPQTAVASLDGA